MGDKFATFIKELTDHEFAIYVAYQYEGLLAYAKEIADQEIRSRGLSQEQFDKFLNEKIPHSLEQLYCKRCGSSRFIQDRDIEHSGGQYSSAEVEVTTNRCRLCNLNPSKAVEKKIFKRIKRYFIDDNRTTKTLRRFYWLDDKPHYPTEGEK